MVRYASLRALGGVAALAVGLGCTWVPLTPEGETIRIVQIERAGDCETLGETRVRTQVFFGPFARSAARAEQEQEALARNHAARKGGNAVAALDAPGGEERSYAILRCPDR